jgi:hypothetical protein
LTSRPIDFIRNWSHGRRAPPYAAILRCNGKEVVKPINHSTAVGLYGFGGVANFPANTAIAGQRS